MKINIKNKTAEIHTHVKTNKDSRISSCMSAPDMKYKYTEIQLTYDEIKEVVEYYWKLQDTIPQQDNMTEDWKKEFNKLMVQNIGTDPYRMYRMYGILEDFISELLDKKQAKDYKKVNKTF